MKLGYALSIVALAVAPLAYAQSGGMTGMDHGHRSAKKAPAASHHATGVVKSVDAEKGSVSVAHGPIASLNWPAMTMTFRAQDKKALQALKPGAKVEFDFEQRGKDYVITKIQ